MATSDVAVTEGSGKNLATHSFSEDAKTKEVSRVNLNDSVGADILGSKTDAAATATDTTAVSAISIWKQISKTLQAAAAAVATAFFVKLTDGTNAAAVKAASTPPAATDPALVVALSPNSVNVNGQATMANSAPVVVASDQSALPVRGTKKWVAGTVGLTWATAQTAAGRFDSIASGNVILSDLALNNSSNLDMFCDIAIVLGSAAFVATNGAYIGILLYPLTQDGSTYGDGRFTSSAAGPPPQQYVVGTIPLVAATQAQTGVLRDVLLPPGSFKLGIYNQGGVALAASSANQLYYRTYNMAIA